MVKPLEQSTHASDLETIFESDTDAMRIYSCTWYVSLALFLLWLGYVACSGG